MSSHNVGEPLVVADIGGTHARFAVATRTADGQIQLTQLKRFLCADFPSASVVLAHYLNDLALPNSQNVVLAVAAPIVEGDVAAQANLPWQVNRAEFARVFPQHTVYLLNDFVALAYAAPLLPIENQTVLCGEVTSTQGPVLVIGPGTGLGAAIFLHGPPSQILASEAGHCALTAVSDEEIELMQSLRKKWPHVDNERVLSGPGICNTYFALCEQQELVARWQNPADITAAAINNQDETARKALSLFCALLGSTVADLAIAMSACKVILAGGIPIQILSFLQASEFTSRFQNKGVMSPLMKKIPVCVVDHGQLALTGAAEWFWDQEL